MGLEGGEQGAARVGVVVALVGLGGEQEADVGLALGERPRDGRGDRDTSARSRDVGRLAALRRARPRRR